MVFAEFYHLGIITGEPIPACGDRAVIILDGRNRTTVHHAIAASECSKRGYIGYTLNRGESFTRSTQQSELKLI